MWRLGAIRQLHSTMTVIVCLDLCDGVSVVFTIYRDIPLRFLGRSYSSPTDNLWTFTQACPKQAVHVSSYMHV